MAEEKFIVAFDIQHAGMPMPAAYAEAPKAVPGHTESLVGNVEVEGKNSSSGANAAKSGLYIHQGSNIVQCKMVELAAKTAAEAVEITRLLFANNPGGERTVIKPNETNFQVIL